MLLENVVELQEMMLHSNDVFLVTDPEGVIIYVNPSIEKVCGLGINSHLKKNIRDLVQEGLINCSATLEALEQKKTVTRRVKTIAGKLVLSTASPVNSAKNSLNHVICNIRSLDVFSPQIKINKQERQFQLSQQEKKKPYRLVNIKNGEYQLAYSSKVMQDVIDLACRLSQVDTTVFIYGETGVGKELIARFIHDQSSRKDSGNFIKVNCASIPANLFESELFGYEAGSFTGALKNGKIGFIELAHEGTLFLDEIGELPLEMQAKILAILQDRQVYRIGSTKPKQVNLRVLSATNRNLRKMVSEGTFREDLFYRLSVIPLEVPPLRSRKEDILTLLTYFISFFCEKYKIKKNIDMKVFHALQNYHWPGNVRELTNLVERLLITTSQKKISLVDLSDYYLHSKVADAFEDMDLSGEIGPLKDMVADFEATMILKALKKCRNYTEAANLLGISLSSFTRRIRRLKEERHYY